MENPDIVKVEQVDWAQDQLVLNEDAFAAEVLEYTAEENQETLNATVHELVNRINNQLTGLDSKDSLTVEIANMVEKVIGDFISNEEASSAQLIKDLAELDDTDEVEDILEKSKTTLSERGGVWLKSLVGSSNYAQRLTSNSREVQKNEQTQ